MDLITMIPSDVHLAAVGLGGLSDVDLATVSLVSLDLAEYFYVSLCYLLHWGELPPPWKTCLIAYSIGYRAKHEPAA